MIERLFLAGADVARLNFSHGTLEQHRETLHRIRATSKTLKKPIAVLIDLPGPKLRTGLNENGSAIKLKEGSTVRLTTRSVLGNSKRIPVMFKGLPSLLNKGDSVLLADGLLELKVLGKKGREVSCKVITGGDLGEHKGINLPGLKIPIPTLTPNDKKALKEVVKWDVDYIALSFIQRASDIEAVQSILKKLKVQISLIAKIEKPEALNHILSILAVADGIMIARGDLGVEVPAARIPVVQKELIHLAALKGVPVITATQMLDSMVTNPRPTRAETTDVANAIWDGSDVVMLSNETATGKYPLETVRTMANIIDQAEGHPDFQWTPPIAQDRTGDAESILIAATRVAQSQAHEAIVTYTKTGNTAIALSKLRPRVPILALTPDVRTYRRLSLVWGVQSLVSPLGGNVDEMIANGDQVLVENKKLRRNARVILVAGTLLTTGATNLMKIHQIGHALTGKTR
jgi:pyruvate kinase